MKAALILSLLATSALAQVPAARIADDAKVINRVAEASKKDLPVNLLRRIVNEDIDVLRGKRADGTYENASYERLEASRTSDSWSIEPNRNDDLSRVEMKGQYLYRVVLDVPQRRLLVTKNKHVYVDRVDVEYIPQGSPGAKVQSVKVGAWIEPGTNKAVDLEQIARSATVRVYAHADKSAGYANLGVTLIEARVFDNPDSPYADAVTSAKAILKALDKEDIPSIRAMSARMEDDLRKGGGTAVARNIDVVAPVATTANPDVYNELQAIEDLMTGTDAERRQGLDRLHQLLRKLRTR